MLNIFKFFVFLLLLPFAYATSASFVEHVRTYPAEFRDFLFYGVIAFFFVFFFVYQFWGLFESGQKMKLGMFKFLAPLDRIVCNIIPFHFLAIMGTAYIFQKFFDSGKYDPYFLFFAGFAMVMHIILVAQDMQEQEKTAIKTDYLFNIVLVVIFNTCIFVLMMDLMRETWTFPAFVNNAYDQFIDIWKVIFKRLSH